MGPGCTPGTGTGLFAGVNTCSVDGFVTLGANAITILLGIVGALSVIFILVGAVQFASSTGDPNRAERAKRTIGLSVLGLVVALSAYAIVTLISQRFGL